MIRWFLLISAVMALADPLLLYGIYAQWGGWAALAAYLLPILAAVPLVRSRKSMQREGDPLPFAMVDALAMPAARLLLLYPGPLTSILGLLLMIGPVRRRLVLLVANRLLGSVTGMTPGLGGFVFHFGRGNQPAVHPPAGELRRAEGRVVENEPRRELPPAAAEGK
jgi:UPF0716 family protein affecting phage T7 exclusion